MEKYDQIGRHYNQTRRADNFLAGRLKYHLAPAVGEKYLDIGCGTGNYTIALSEKGFDFVGIDPSQEMLKKAKLRKSDVEWKEGRADDIPLDDNSVDGITAVLTVHHWDNLSRAFKELTRVLKSSGRIVIFTSTPEQMSEYWLNHYFPQMLEESIDQMPGLEVVETAMINSGFEIVETEKYFVREDIADRFLYSGKHHPERYLSEEFRQGISSFTNLAIETEVEKGLRNLEKDIKTSRIETAISDYGNDEGDYLFLVATNKKEAGENPLQA